MLENREETKKDTEKINPVVEKVADGIWRIGVELPQNPLRELNSYLLKGKENGRDLLIDTGFRREECREALFAGLRALGSSPERLDILLTHLHSDHTGLAREAAGADSRIYISGTDLEILKDGFTPERPLRLAAQFRAGGFPEDEMKKTQALNPAIRYKLDQVDERFIPIEAGWNYTVGDYTLEMISVPGHTPGNAMFWAEKQGIMFMGDHILFDISPNITSWLESEDSLGDYLDSLRRARKYPVHLALPGHRKTGDYAARIEALLAHHERRLAETEALLAEYPGMTAYEAAGKMRWKIRAASWEEFPPSQKWFAVGECMAHLDYLRLRGRIRREMDGEVWRYYKI